MSKVLDFCEKSCFLVSFTSVLSLVQSYISTTNRSNSNIDPSLILLGMHRSSLKSLVTSEKDFQVSYAVLFPLPSKADTVSHPKKAWKTGSARRHVGVIVATILDDTRLLLHVADSCAEGVYEDNHAYC